MKIVIDIPEDLYEGIKCRNGELETEYVCDELMKAIDNGTVLPKGHGRLIDADAINIHDVSPAYGMEVYGVTQDDIEYEPTVIEADREVEDD